jgi:DNA-binding transcriptional LysR family regulator
VTWVHEDTEATRVGESEQRRPGISELASHRTLVHTSPRSATISPWDRWAFQGKGEQGVVEVRHHLVTDDREALLEAALAGAGVFRIGMFTPELLSSGRRTRLLAEWAWPGGPELSLLYRRGARLPRRVTAFIEFAAGAVTAFDPLELTLEQRR